MFPDNFNPFFHAHRSAYHQYARVNNSIVKEELIKEGKDTSLGALVSIVSAKVSLLFHLNDRKQ
jgi:hypothetical protein